MVTTEFQGRPQEPNIADSNLTQADDLLDSAQAGRDPHRQIEPSLSSRLIGGWQEHTRRWQKKGHGHGRVPIGPMARVDQRAARTIVTMRSRRPASIVRCGGSEVSHSATWSGARTAQVALRSAFGSVPTTAA